MGGYTVGTLHPSAMRRQWSELSEAEAADVAEAVVAGFAAELRRQHVAGGDLAPTWAVAEELRETITRHHSQASRRREEQSK